MPLEKKRSFLMLMKKIHTVTWFVSMVAIYLTDDNEN